MMSNYRSQASNNYEHNVFSGISARQNQTELFTDFLKDQDVSLNTVNALTLDIRKFAKWFTAANQEPWDIDRVASRGYGGKPAFSRRVADLVIPVLTP